MKRQKCRLCEGDVDKTARALCQKLLDRDAKKFFCLACLADFLDTTEDELREKAEEFKNEGCELFR